MAACSAEFSGWPKNLLWDRRRRPSDCVPRLYLAGTIEVRTHFAPRIAQRRIYENSRFMVVLATFGPRDTQKGDRNVCTSPHFFEVHAREGHARGIGPQQQNRAASSKRLRRPSGHRKHQSKSRRAATSGDFGTDPRHFASCRAPIRRLAQPRAKPCFV